MIGVATKGGANGYYVTAYSVEYFNNTMNTMQPITDTTGQTMVSSS